MNTTVSSNKNLMEQVRRILDEAKEASIDVIIKMEFQRTQAEALTKAAGDALAARRMALSSRDLLPFSFSRSVANRLALKAGAVTAQARKRLATAETIALAQIKKYGLTSLEPLLSNDIVRQVLDKMAPASQTHGQKEWRPRQFWTSRSMPLSMTRDELNKLSREMPNIKSVHLNRTLNIPTLVETKVLEMETNNILSATWGLEKIRALAAWGAHGAYGEGILIGLLDTGVDDSHPDLVDKVSFWAEFDSLGQPVQGSKPHDSDQHGTHCAGTLVGGKHSGRYIGIAPKAKLAAGLVLNGKKGGTDAQVLAGIDWAVEQKVDIISMSLGGLVIDVETPPTYTDAILSCMEAGIPLVAAIGNEGHQTSGLPGNDPLAFSVGATDPSDRIAGFSGGRTQIIRESDVFPPDRLPMSYSKPDVSAPGVGIHSSVPGGEWKVFSGTSMATPHVAGAMALLLSATNIKGGIDGYEKAFLIQNLMTSSVEELGESGQDHRYGFGRVDILRAIDFAHNLGYK